MSIESGLRSVRQLRGGFVLHMACVAVFVAALMAPAVFYVAWRLLYGLAEAANEVIRWLVGVAERIVLDDGDYQ